MLFIEKHNTVTLATVGKKGPNAAAVFYAFNRKRNSLLFLSKPEAQHIKNLELNELCASTIQKDGLNWELIQGVQLRGKIELAKKEDWSIYYEKYPFVKQNKKLKKLIKKVNLYSFNVKWARFIDNSDGLGNNIEINY